MEKIKSYQEDSEVQKNRWWILVSVAMFTFMSTLDSSIVNIAFTDYFKRNVRTHESSGMGRIYLFNGCLCLFIIIWKNWRQFWKNKSLSNWHGYFYDWFVTLWL